MIRHYLNINSYKYCVDYIPFDEIPDNQKHYEKYVMIRKFDLMNNIVVDKDIYFISKSFFEINPETGKSILEENYNENENLLFDNIVFPSTNSVMNYSCHYNAFNDTFIDNDLFKKYSVYDLYTKEYQDEDNYEIVEKKIKCDLFKVYHPHIKSQNNLIIHVKNVINNITFHYICNKYSNFNINSETEFRHENNIYSEYVYFYIPNIFDLFGTNITKNGEFLTYFIENLNVVDIEDENNTISSNNSEEFIKNAIILLDNNKKQYIGLGLLTQRSKIIEENGINKKLYLKFKNNYEKNYLTSPLNIILYPYSSLNKPNKIYLLDDYLLPISQSFIKEYKFTLKAICDFNEDNSELSIITDFEYPEKDLFESYYANHNSSLTEAYCYFNGISKEDRIVYKDENDNIISNKYGKGLNELKEQYKIQLDEISKINESYITNKVKKNLYGLNYKNYSNSEALERVKELRLESFIEEYIEEYNVNIDFFGLLIDIYSDEYFKNKIYTNYIKLSKINIIDWIKDNNNQILDLFNILGDGKFRFSLLNIFNDWNQLPECIFVKVAFIDRLLGIQINANNVLITKEKFKYMINHKNHFRLESLYNINKDMKEYTYNSDENVFNFINNVNCIISKNGTNLSTLNALKNKINEYIENEDDKSVIINKILDDITKLANGMNNEETNNYISSKVQYIYKPIFYKVQTLDNIILRQNQIQKIALDLHKYENKVSTFKLMIENNIYEEISRNYNNIIFEVNANELNNLNGKYNIYNEDNEYISSGTWQIS